MTLAELYTEYIEESVKSFDVIDTCETYIEKSAIDKHRLMFSYFLRYYLWKEIENIYYEYSMFLINWNTYY